MSVARKSEMIASFLIVKELMVEILIMKCLVFVIWYMDCMYVVEAGSECASGGNSGSEECDDMLVALRRQIQPHLMLAALQQTSNFQPTAGARSFKRDEPNEAPLNLVAGQQ